MEEAKIEENNYDGFYATIYEHGNSNSIVVDHMVIKANNLKKGDRIKVWIKKVD